MAKRFTDTNIWKSQSWYRRLSPINKLFWKYLTDSCNHAGVWKIDYMAMTEDLAVESFSIADFIEACNKDFDKLTGKPVKKERVILVDDCYLWLTGFIQFQYESKEGKVCPKVPAVKSALAILKGLEILQQALEKGFIRLTEPLEKGYSTLKEKDRYKDKDKKEDEGMGEETIVPAQSGLCHEMLKVFIEFNPQYQHDQKDLSALLEITYKIAAMRHYSKSSVTGENRGKIVQEWRSLLSRVRSDPFYSAKDIAYLNKDWKSLTLKFPTPLFQNGRLKNSEFI
jgi:hypothetical protein